MNLLGQTIGRYQIEEQLGEGGMATVYRALDTRLDRMVAIKFIRKDAFTTELLEQVLIRFEREAKALARLTHPNIVNVHDYGDYEGAPYFVMQYVPGGTLRQRTGRPLAWAEAIRLVLPVARALSYAHAQNIVHRDVKPSNILLTESGEPMLMDFGIAKILDLSTGATLTGAGTGIGTPEYMAPEQAMGNPVDGRADVYALSVVLYELVTGRTPYQADTPMAVMLKHITEPLPDPRQFVPGLPPSLVAVLSRALQKQPIDRYADMQALISALEGLLMQPGNALPPTPVATAIPQEVLPPTPTAAPVIGENPLATPAAVPVIGETAPPTPAAATAIGENPPPTPAAATAIGETVPSSPEEATIIGEPPPPTPAAASVIEETAPPTAAAAISIGESALPTPVVTGNGAADRIPPPPHPAAVPGQTPAGPPGKDRLAHPGKSRKHLPRWVWLVGGGIILLALVAATLAIGLGQYFSRQGGFELPALFTRATTTFTPTATVTVTPRPTQTTAPSLTATATATLKPSLTATKTRTPTITTTPSITLTPTVTLTPSKTASPTPAKASLGEPTFSTNTVSYYAGCVNDQLGIELDVTDPDGIYLINIYYRIVDQSTGEMTDWALVPVLMEKQTGDHYTLTLPALRQMGLNGWIANRFSTYGGSWTGLLQLQFIVVDLNRDVTNSKNYDIQLTGCG